MRTKRILVTVLTTFVVAYLGLLGTLYLAQRSIIYPAPSGPGRDVPGFEKVTYRTSDGLQLTAGYRSGGSGMPVILYFHGNGADWQSSVVATDQLVPEGYGVLAAEYRGYRGNPGRPSEAGLYEDGRAAIQWLGARAIKPAQIVVIGNSIGGGVATQMAVEHDIRALVLISPFTSLPDVAAEKIWWAPTRSLVSDRFANRDKLGRVDAPILLLHGDADTLIGPHHSETLAEVNARAELVIFPDAGHELAWLPQAEKRTLEFLEDLNVAAE